MTRGDFNIVEDASEEMTISVRGRIKSRHSIKSWEELEPISHDFRAELRMHYLTVECETFSNELNTQLKHWKVQQ